MIFFAVFLRLVKILVLGKNNQIDENDVPTKRGVDNGERRKQLKSE